jgi:hypothetical protein
MQSSDNKCNPPQRNRPAADRPLGFLSTVPSGLLVAVTAHISTELTSAPLL